MTHPALKCLEQALYETCESIAAGDAVIAQNRKIVAAAKDKLKKLYKQQDELTAAIALVRKRVQP